MSFKLPIELRTVNQSCKFYDNKKTKMIVPKLISHFWRVIIHVEMPLPIYQQLSML